MQRRHLKLSQHELAKLCGFDHSYISRVEAGLRMPDPGNLATIVRKLQFRPRDELELFYQAGYLPSCLVLWQDEVASVVEYEQWKANQSRNRPSERLLTS